MQNITIWHNPRCSKSRQALALLEGVGITPKVVKYLENPPTTTELEATLKQLQCGPAQLVRRGEAVFKTLTLSEKNSDQEWIKAMVNNPIIIERPIIICDDRAVIGRPPENIYGLLEPLERS
ncbi:MAG: arsenate reductase (glutaredoxin) [Luminiphilus sp.]|nr:arsenate reductase (glutaredoxin) [Luminiphilus sp.]